jgi:hypothetical protein
MSSGALNGTRCLGKEGQFSFQNMEKVQSSFPLGTWTPLSQLPSVLYL